MKKIQIASVLIKRDDKFLLVKASIGAPAGLWNHPGGHVDPGETPQEAAEREAWEELGYRVKVGKLVGTYQAMVKGAEVTKHVYLAEIVGGELNPREDEIAETRWFGMDELDGKYQFTAGTKQSLIDYSEGKLGVDHEVAGLP